MVKNVIGDIMYFVKLRSAPCRWLLYSTVALICAVNVLALCLNISTFINTVEKPSVAAPKSKLDPERGTADPQLAKAVEELLQDIEETQLSVDTITTVHRSELDTIVEALNKLRSRVDEYYSTIKLAPDSSNDTSQAMTSSEIQLNTLPLYRNCTTSIKACNIFSVDNEAKFVGCSTFKVQAEETGNVISNCLMVGSRNGSLPASASLILQNGQWSCSCHEIQKFKRFCITVHRL